MRSRMRITATKSMDTILKIEDLTVHFEMQDGTVKALNHLDFDLQRGSCHGLVGETGAGKTTLAKAIMGLTEKPQGKVKSGNISYEGKNLLDLSEHEMRKIRGEHISMIFQDPMTSLNPVVPIIKQVEESIQTHNKLHKTEIRKRALEILEMVGIPEERADEYPHQFSGGMKQRVVIAIALACKPQILIADEPTTALDVTVQAQVLAMIAQLKERLNTSVLLITHDLGVVAQNCNYVSVLYAGEIVETGTTQDIFKRMAHPYTIGLFSSIPKLNDDVKRLQPIRGLMPDPTNLPSGCFFCDRCNYATERCANEHPKLVKVDDKECAHQVRCFHMQNSMGGCRDEKQDVARS